MTLAIGGLRFPLTASSLDLLPQCDPFASTFLAYWQKVINHYCAAAYAAAIPGQKQTSAAEAACAETTPLDPLMWLSGGTFRLPVLGCYPVQGTRAGKHTQRWEKVETEYVVCYALPMLTAEQAARVMPLLNAVQALIVLTTERQGDENYDGGTNPLATAGVMSVTFGQTRFGLIKEEGSPTGFPCVEMHVLVTMREDIVATDGTTIAGYDATVDAGEHELATDLLPADILLTAAIEGAVEIAPVTVALSAGTVATAASLS